MSNCGTAVISDNDEEGNFEENMAGEPETFPFIAVEIISLLEQVLESSGQGAEILTLECLDGCVLIKTKQNREIPVFKHMLSANTRVTQQLLDQQCSMLVLLLVCRRQGGEVVFKGGKQSFSMTLSLPGFQESEFIRNDD